VPAWNLPTSRGSIMPWQRRSASAKQRARRKARTWKSRKKGSDGRKRAKKVKGQKHTGLGIWVELIPFAESLALDISEKELCIAEHDALEIRADHLEIQALRHAVMLRDGLINLLKKLVAER
jgi:hypothetical protein